MRFSSALVAMAAATGALAAPAVDTPTPTVKRASKFQFVGVNQAGAEFGNKDLPGTLGKHYTWPVHSTIDVSMLLCQVGELWTDVGRRSTPKASTPTGLRL